MSDDKLNDLLEFALMFCGIGFIVLEILIISSFIKKIRVIEDKIATPGTQLAGIKSVWGDGPLGRIMRAMHVFMFFTFRNIPLVGSKFEKRMGNEGKNLPIRMKIWAVAPMALCLMMMTITALCAWKLGAI